MIYRRYAKRTLDLAAATLLGALLLPVFALVAVLIRIDSPGPVLFWQPRIGIRGEEFHIAKFRTMRVNSEAQGVYTTAGDSRVTRVGRFLRATSVDELPQLVNILRGEMSFIGPRPPLIYHPWVYSKYSEEQMLRFIMRPGLTGLAQISGRKTLDWNTRIVLDVKYVRECSLRMDLKILLATAVLVLTMKDNHNHGATI